MSDWIGYRWLQMHYRLAPVQQLRTHCAIGARRQTIHDHGRVQEFYTARQRPQATLAGHLGFALKHEGVQLELLSRLFAQTGPAELEAWIAAEPTGQYARRAGFLYEWLTGRRLAFPGVRSGNYVPILDPALYITATRTTNDARWRVRDNLPGTPDYCPTVARTQAVTAAETYAAKAQLEALETCYGQDFLRRSAVWLTVKESRASFAIEHEEQHEGRIQRFAAAMEAMCGAGARGLDIDVLQDLQARILGPRATRYGLRQSPVFVGAMDGFVPVVHYIAPHWDDVPRLLDGLRAFEERTIGSAAVVRAAVLSFGFVYIHPMVDGNGRISRFLINDTLRRDGMVPSPLILPVSATITQSVVRRQGYDDVLEVFSRPFMRHFAGSYRFGPERRAPDGVLYNLEFDGYAEALAAWRFPDLTEHAAYLAEVVRATLEEEMPREARYLRRLRELRERVKNVVEGPDTDVDRIIRSIQQHGGVSSALRKQFPLLGDADLAQRLIDAIASVTDEDTD
ncbi:Fic family protein [Verticiella sediminum]|uniref:Fic family protein n=1 Tax=Verticiella sediminum TaxID=1247510 RepID=A0A556AY94_9BURK|nr:Fic family protein [Verticiella sediminum]TSH97888.1 Fic family protein [Verticiella sediminum]